MKYKMHLIFEKVKKGKWEAVGMKNEALLFLKKMIEQNGPSKELLSAYYACTPYTYDDFLGLDNQYLQALLSGLKNGIRTIGVKTIEGTIINYKVGYRVKTLKQKSSSPDKLSIVTEKKLNKSKNIYFPGFYTLAELKSLYDYRQRISFSGFISLEEYLRLKNNSDEIIKNLIYEIPKGKIINKNIADSYIGKEIDSSTYVHLELTKAVSFTGIKTLIDYLSSLPGKDENKRIVFWIEEIT